MRATGPGEVGNPFLTRVPGGAAKHHAKTTWHYTCLVGPAGIYYPGAAPCVFTCSM